MVVPSKLTFKIDLKNVESFPRFPDQKKINVIDSNQTYSSKDLSFAGCRTSVKCEPFCTVEKARKCQHFYKSA